MINITQALKLARALITFFLSFMAGLGIYSAINTPVNHENSIIQPVDIKPQKDTISRPRLFDRCSTCGMG
jgi:hypothetical protein